MTDLPTFVNEPIGELRRATVRDELHADIEPWVDQLFEVVGQLMVDRVAQPGFSVFLLAARPVIGVTVAALVAVSFAQKRLIGLRLRA